MKEIAHRKKGKTKHHEEYFIMKKIKNDIKNRVILKYAATYNHPEPPTTIHNHPQSSATTHNHPQPSTTILSFPELLISTHNHPQPPRTTQKSTHKQPKNHQQSPTTIHNHPKRTQKSQNLSQAVMLLHFRC